MIIWREPSSANLPRLEFFILFRLIWLSTEARPGNMPKITPLTPIHNVLEELIKSCGLETHMLEARLKHEWPTIVGSNIAQHALPEQIRFNKLYLFIDSPAWIQELTFFKPELLRKTNAALLRFEVDFRIEEIVLRLDRGLSGDPAPFKTPRYS